MFIETMNVDKITNAFIIFMQKIKIGML